MARTDAESVRGIIDLDPGRDIDPLIDSASMLVDLIVVPNSPQYEDDQLTEIEKWLAAHLCTFDDPRPIMTMIGQSQDQFEINKTDLGLKGTRFGQQAMILDTDGSLARYNAAAMGKGAKKKILWLGGYDDDE